MLYSQDNLGLSYYWRRERPIFCLYFLCIKQTFPVRWTDQNQEKIQGVPKKLQMNILSINSLEPGPADEMENQVLSISQFVINCLWNKIYICEKYVQIPYVEVFFWTPCMFCYASVSQSVKKSDQCQLCGVQIAYEITTNMYYIFLMDTL